MNYFKQYKEMLAQVGDEDVKTQLLDGLGKLEGIFDDAIDTRDKAKEKARSLTELTEGISKQFGIEEVTVDNLKKVLEGTNDNDEVKRVYESKMDELRGMVSSKEGEYGDLKSKFDDMVFSNQIETLGLLKGFKDNPLLRKQVVEHLKSSLIADNGKLFVKGEDGAAAKDIKTGDYISPTSLVESMKSNELWADFVAPTVNTGGGMQQSSRQTPVNTELSSTEKMKQGRN